MARYSKRLIALACLGVSVAATAADVPTPGSVGDTLKRPAPPLLPPSPPAVQPFAERSPAAPATGGKSFTVSRFSFSGNTRFSSPELAAQLSDLLGKPITVAQLYQGAERLTRFYRLAGYPLASVSIPPQSLVAGQVELRVIEGQIASIGFDGNRSYSADFLSYFFRKVRIGEVYRSGSLESDLQIINTLPGLSTKAILKPGEAYGTSDIVIKTSEKRVEGSLIADNYGRKDVGEYRYSGIVTINNPRGVADQLQLMGLHSNNNGLNYGLASYSLPINNAGARVKASYGWAHFTVAGAQPVTGDNRNTAVEVQLPLVHSYHNKVTATVGVNHTAADADLKALGGNLPVSRTEITLAEVGAVLSHNWLGGAVTQNAISVRSNFRGANPQQRDEGQPLRLEVDAQHLQPLPWWRGSSLLLHVNSVYSPEPLADTEQFSLGGPGSLRGFAPSEARGDRGAFASLSLQKAWTFGPLAFIPRVFADTGRAVQLDVLPSGRNRSESLSNAGVGFDASYRGATVKLDWSRPLDSRPVSDGRNESRVYAGLSFNF